MTAVYTFDIFSTLDGYGSYTANANWGGYWGKQGPEFLDHRLALYSAEQRMVFGANTYRQRSRRPPQEGVRGAVALERQPVVEPGR